MPHEHPIRGSGTETEMADKVDALAILDDVIADMGDLPGTQGHELAKARAAVAELIEAALNVSWCCHCADDLLGEWAALAAALDNVTGGAA